MNIVRVMVQYLEIGSQQSGFLRQNRYDRILLKPSLAPRRLRSEDVQIKVDVTDKIT